MISAEERGYRTRVSSDGLNGLIATIPVIRKPFSIAFCCLWLCGWFIGECAVILRFVSGKAFAQPSFPLLIVWLIFWTIGGGFVFTALCWSIAGREIIHVDHDSLTYRREVGPFGITRTLPLSDVRNMRYSPLVYNPWNPPRGFSQSFLAFGIGGGSIAFDFLGKTIHIGDYLPEIEARRLVATIKQNVKIPDDPYDKPLPIED